MGYHGRRGRRSWGRRYRRYRHPSNRSTIAEYKVRTYYDLLIPPAGTAPGTTRSGFIVCIWNFPTPNPTGDAPTPFPWQFGAANAPVAINSIAFYTALIRTRLYMSQTIKCIKVRLWPVNPGVSAQTEYMPDEGGFGVNQDYLQRGVTMFYNDPVWDMNPPYPEGQQVGLYGGYPADFPPGTTTNLLLNTFPEMRLRHCADAVRETGKCTFKHVYNIPKMYRDTEWPAFSDPSDNLPPPPTAAGYGNVSVKIYCDNFQGPNNNSAYAIYRCEVTYYLRLRGRQSFV